MSVVGRDAREVVVHAELQGSDDFLSRFHITSEQTPSGVTISAHMAHDGWFHWFHVEPQHVRFTITVPRDYPVDLRTSGGHVDVRSLNASVHARTSGGSIRVEDVNGSVDVHSSGGGIDAERLNGASRLITSGGGIDVEDSTGDLDARTSGGSIRIRNDDGRVHAHTSGGGIRAQLRANHGATLTTSGGSITLFLPGDAHASVDAETSGGRVTVDFPLSSARRTDKRHLVGEIGGGGASIFLRTSGGSIHLEQER